MNYWTQSEKNIYVAAHRGWSAKYPENTMESFRAAIELDVDQIETDVRETKDGELICIHDGTVDRTTDGSGDVHDMTLAEIKQLDAGIHKGEEFKGARVPTFIEFMDLVKDHPTMTIDIELKEYPVEGNEKRAYNVCDRVLKIIDDYGFTDRCVINTFSGKLHEYIHEKHGNKYRQHVYFPVGKMKNVSDNPIDPYTYGYCVCMFSGIKGVPASQEQYDSMKKYGIRMWAPTSVKDEERISMAVEGGIELITCDNPDEVLEILRRKGLHK